MNEKILSVPYLENYSQNMKKNEDYISCVIGEKILLSEYF